MNLSADAVFFCGLEPEPPVHGSKIFEPDRNMSSSCSGPVQFRFYIWLVSGRFWPIRFRVRTSPWSGLPPEAPHYSYFKKLRHLIEQKNCWDTKIAKIEKLRYMIEQKNYWDTKIAKVEKFRYQNSKNSKVEILD